MYYQEENVAYMVKKKPIQVILHLIYPFVNK